MPRMKPVEVDPKIISSSKGKKIFKQSKKRLDEYQIERVKNSFRNKKGGPWPDFAFNFIIYFLVEYAKENSRKPHYGLIASFLSEKGVVDGVNIEKRYKGIDRNKLWVLYNRLRIFEQEYFDRLFQYGELSPLLEK